MIDVDALVLGRRLCRNVGAETTNIRFLRVRDLDIDLELESLVSTFTSNPDASALLSKRCTSSRALKKTSPKPQVSRLAFQIQLSRSPSDPHAPRYPPMMDKTGKPLSLIEPMCGFKPQHIGTRTPVSLPDPFEDSGGRDPV